ncbi:CRISPR-associated helicase Cas3' [Stutzerimonas stutzeri]|uniref:CRISPR-associated helicase Cas3' n=1 Tax=Stutzerimonas stutzeri TaxID=316 RepID=UPI00244B2E53|nr:CRISPR-associated helicase Cas3' [Stutzerimonas stutzeri]MDH0609863.1 CRISPR-associated helicase Cas3' [Stutzerimonas stutzeri]
MSFTDCPAKTYLEPESGDTILGRSVVEHCQIVGEVAKALIKRYPADLQSQLFPVDASFAAACHDIGKVSPYFVEKIRRACSSWRCALAPLDVNPELERQWGGHAGVSQVAAKALGAPSLVAEILGQHHGFSPPVAGKRAADEVFGAEPWQAQRGALLDELKARLGMDWPQVASVEQARLIAGLTSVADWIGSGQYFEDPDLPWQGSIERALDEAGFIPPRYRAELSFEQVFGFTPRQAQTQLIDTVTGPGVYVLEAPMGLGKTEAALYAAYRMLAGGQASGIYFALPTQLTSNKIYERFNEFLQEVLVEDCQHRSLLLHGNAWLLDAEMGEEGRPGGAWFNQAKRGLLAPFAVGTIDQALMAAMNVKHGFVRAFGLAGKVVILDEVHTYDAYTGTLLDALVELLRGMHCTVIILSATLNQERRQHLLNAKLSSQAYPLITAIARQQVACEYPVPSDAGQEVALRLLVQDELAIEEALDRACQGQQVLWIENTVAEAQQRYLDLAAKASELGLASGLLHSRFSVDDRERIETHWVDLFGKRGWDRRGEQGRILVGTQVLEQSLDIDADFLVSRFAPSDMLLQRLGRLWRHGETPRATDARCEAWLLAPQLEAAIAAPPSAFGSSAYVYSPYVLCRSLEVWQGRASLCLPQDIRPLIEQTYAARAEDGDMARWLHELDNGTQGRGARKGRKALRQLARVTLAEGGKTLPESQAQTRYSESDSHDLLLLRGLTYLPDKQASRLVLLDGSQLTLPLRRNQLTKQQWRQLTATLMRQMVPVRVGDAPLPLSRDTLTKLGLHHCFYLGDPNWADDESLLRVALVDETGALQGVHGARIHDKHSLDYRDDLGYRVIKD